MLADRGKYDTTTVRRANFVRNAGKFKHQDGGAIDYADNIAFPTEGDARRFSEHYKKYFPDYFKSFGKGGNLKPEF